jgi:hypothetical protein
MRPSRAATALLSTVFLAGCSPADDGERTPSTQVDPGLERSLLALAKTYLEARASLVLSTSEGRIWSSAKVTVTPVRWTALPGGRLGATVVENTRLYLDRTRDPAAPEYTGQSIRRIFEFEPHPGGWRIRDHHLEHSAEPAPIF